MKNSGHDTKSVDSWAATLEKCIALEKSAVVRKGVALLHHMNEMDWNVLEGRDRPDCLWANSSEQDSQELPNKFYAVAKDAYIDAGGSIVSPVTEEEKWRCQNDLMDYFHLLHDDYLSLLHDNQIVFNSELHNHPVVAQAAKQLCLYDCLHVIDSFFPRQFRQERIKKIPYLYERLCNCMRELVTTDAFDVDMCYLVHYQQGNFRTLATSSPPVSCLGTILNTADYETITSKRRQIREGSSNNAGQLVAATVFQTALIKEEPYEPSLEEIEASNNPESKEYLRRLLHTSQAYYHRILAVRLDLPQKSKERFYLFFQKREASPIQTDKIENNQFPISNAQLICVKYLLAFREMITRMTEHNLPDLLLAQSSCRYICPRNNQISANDVIILHLTDLHIRARDHVKLQKLFSKFAQHKTQDTENKKIDLMVITGDIVQAQSTARELEDNYQVATSLLRLLAQQLWSYTLPNAPLKCYLRADWQKRIIVIPGNHDYASMNELESVLDSRRTISGYPAKREGSSTVKFAYFIQFLQNLLGVGIEEQYLGRLNTIKFYDTLNVTFLCLNTSAGAGPLRNNKMCLDRNFLENIQPAQFSKGNITICLAHHLPTYTPNYLVDRYYSKLLGDATTEICDQFMTILSTNNNDNTEQLEFQLTRLFKRFLAGFSEYDFHIDPFLDDYIYFLNNHRNNDERCRLIRDSVLRDRDAGLLDANDYQAKFKKLADNAKIKIVLGGHIHETKLDNRCYAGPRAINAAIDRLNYGILRLHETEHGWYEYRIEKDEEGNYNSKPCEENGHWVENISHKDPINFS